MKRFFRLDERAQRALGAALLCAPLAAPSAAQSAESAGASGPPAASHKQLERGRYLVKIGGCNDCHTPGYGLSGGKVAEKDWLVGDKLGFSGPWGTTYPSNLRLMMAKLTEAQWMELARHKELRPPMPWFNLRAMTPEDQRAIYRYVKWLGPKGEAAPDYLPPGQAPQGPAVVFPAPPKQ